MKSYEYLVNDNIGQTLGVFDFIEHAIIFVKSLFEFYYNKENFEVTIVRQERTNLC